MLFYFSPETLDRARYQRDGFYGLVCEHDVETGALIELETVDTPPQGIRGNEFLGRNSVQYFGEWLYTLNWGHVSVAIMLVDKGTGQIKSISHASARGDWLSYFTVSRDGSFLLVERCDNDSIAAFSIKDTTGELTSTSSQLAVPNRSASSSLTPRI